MALDRSRVTDPREVSRLFSRIAPRYDLLNRIMSLGQDRGWRGQLLDLILDLCAGTGDVALLARRSFPGRLVVAADASAGMLRQGRARADSIPLAGWVLADATSLPLREGKFGALTVAFGVRNVIALDRLLDGAMRVLRPGGRLAILDIFAPSNDLLGRGYSIYLRHFVPALGAAVGGDGAAYRHLAASVHAFGRPEELAARLASAGFANARYRAMNLGTIGLVWGDRR